MPQLDAELFTSFQSVLDSLQELSIINDTNAANLTTGTLDSVPVDLKVKILKLSNLETCLALSESCGTYRKLWESLDKTLVREKVLKRVPWFALNEGSTGLTSWNQCAHVVVARTQHCLKTSPDIMVRKGRLPIKSLEMAFLRPVTKYRRVNATDVTEDTETREKMKPMFPDKLTDALTGLQIYGSNLHHVDLMLDLKTMQAKRGPHTFQLEEINYPAHLDIAHAPAPGSGTEFRHVDPNGTVGFVEENDNLMHIVYSTSRPYFDPEMLGIGRAGVNAIIHKASHPRDIDGVLIIDPEKLIMQQPEDDMSVPLINLLPGSGGALIARFSAVRNVSGYLGYIEPTEDLRHTILCAVPCPAVGGFEAHDHFNQKFYATYNGYLYYFHEGRFIQLWVDLGYQKELKMKAAIRREIGHHTLPQKTDTRALCAINVFFPHIGTFCIFPDKYKILSIIQGDKNQGLDRFITLRAAYGLVVGDLLTGETYVCKNHKDNRQLVIPYIDNKKKKTVGFYSFSTYTSSRLTDIMRKMLAQEVDAVDLNMRYDCMHGAPLSLQEQDRVKTPYLDPGVHGKKDFYLYPRQVQVSQPAFLDNPLEFTNIDGDEKLVYDDNKDEDLEDWDCGANPGRYFRKYNMDSDRDDDLREFESELDNTMKNALSGKKPSIYYKKGRHDGLRGRPDKRYDKQEYFKGYHEAYRERFGYTDPKDKDDYWGSNPRHGKWYLS